MSTVRVTIDSQHLQATPGQPATIDVGIYNAGQIVDEITVTVLGLEQSWVSYEPPRLSLLPDSTGRVRITVAIPAEAPVAEGRRVIGIKVTSVGASGSSWVEEMTVDIGRVSGATLRADPQLVRGGRTAKFHVDVDNRGNHPLDLVLDGSDPERVVDFRFTPGRLRVPPHGTGFARAVASAPRAFTGHETQRPLTVRGTGDGTELTAQLTFSQRPWISRGVLMAVPLVLVLGALGLVAACAMGYCSSDDEQPVAAEDTVTEESAEDADDEEVVDEGGGSDEADDTGDEDDGGGEDDEPAPEPQEWTRDLDIRPGSATYAFRTTEPGRIFSIAEWGANSRVLELSLTGPPHAPALAATADNGIVDLEYEVPVGDHDSEDVWLLALTDRGPVGGGGVGLAPAPAPFLGELDLSFPGPTIDGFFEHPFVVTTSSGSDTTVLLVTEPGELTATVDWPGQVTLTLLGPDRDHVYEIVTGSGEPVTLTYQIRPEDVADGDVWFVVAESEDADVGTLELRYP